MSENVRPPDRQRGGQEQPLVRSAAALPADRTPLEPLAPAQAPRAGMAARPLTPGLLWQQRWLALAAFLLFAVPVAAAIWLFYRPMFTARAVIEVSPTIPRIIYRTEDNGAVPFYRQYLNTQAATILSPVVLNRALDHGRVQATRWYRYKPLLPRAAPSPLERLRKELSVRPRPQTNLIDVRLGALVAQEAALIVNAVVDEYLRYVVERSTQVDDEVYRQVARQYDELRLKIEGLRSGIDRLRGQIGHWTPEQLLAQQSSRLDLKKAERKALQDKIVIARWQQRQLRALVPADTQPAPPGSPPAAAEPPPYEADPEWRRLKLEWQTARDQVALEQHLGQEHPTMVRLRLAARQAREKLRDRQRQLDELWRAQPEQLPGGAAGQENAALRLGQLGRDIARMEFEIGLKDKDIQAEQQQVNATAEAARMLQRDLDELHDLESRFHDVRERKFTMEIERRAPAAIRVQARAQPSSEPANARRRLMFVAMALLGGVMLGVLAAYLRVTAAAAVQDAGELAAALPLPFLGCLPLTRRRDARERALQAECVRMVRTALLQRLEGAGGSAIQITSAGPGAGKTTLAVMLAESLMRCGKKVLLVDADLRNPAIHRRCGVAPEPGLAGLLSARASEAEAIVAGGSAAPAILPVGRIDGETDSELLANGLLARCVQRWCRQFDVVLFDSSPVVPVADARILSRHVHGTILVVRGRHCQRAEVAEALNELGSAGGVLLGVVFVGNERSGAYYRGYRPQRYASAAPEA